MRTIVLSALAILLCAPYASAGLSLDVDPPEVPDPVATASGNWAYAWLDTPLDGGALSGVVELAGRSEAADGYQVRYVDVWVDDRFLGRADGTTEWTYALDTRRLVDGDHRIYVAALASPRDAPTPVRLGWGSTTAFETLNTAAAEEDARVVLFDQTLVFTGVQPTTWTYRLPQDLTGLRVRFESADADGGPAVGHAVVHYVPPAGADAAKVRTWHATYGPHSAAASLSQHQHDVLNDGGVLVLSSQVVGMGQLRLVVEALPVEDAQPPAAAATPSFQMRY